MPKGNEQSSYMNAGIAGQVLLLAVVLAAMAYLGLRYGGADQRGLVWLGILGLMTAFALLVAKFITGYWRGILINSQNKMSLSQMQMFAWSMVVLSALVTAVLSNVAATSAAPFAIDIPTELFIVMGISTASLVASPAVLSVKKSQRADPKELIKAATVLKEQGQEDVDTEHASVIVKNKTASGARWADLMKGEEAGNATTVDLGKMQMFLFTFILVIGYSAAVYSMFEAAGEIAELPAVSQGMATLLGISHTGYLAYKGVNHSSTAAAGGETTTK